MYRSDGGVVKAIDFKFKGHRFKLTYGKLLVLFSFFNSLPVFTKLLLSYNIDRNQFKAFNNDLQI